MSIATNLTIGNTYKIQIYTTDTGPAKMATFDICITTPPPVTNDDGLSTIELSPTDLPSTVSTPGFVTGATASTPTNTCEGNANDDVWYKFVATTTNNYITLKDVKGISTNLNHAVYSGNCDSLVFKYCSALNSLSSNAKTFVIGETYYVRVWSNAADAQSINYNICLGIVSPPITVSTTQYTKTELIKDILMSSPCANVSNFTSSTGTNFQSLDGIGYFNKAASAFPFKDGIILSTGNVLSAPGPNTATALSEGSTVWAGDSQLEGVILAGTGKPMSSKNASRLEFDFVPVSDLIKFNLIFASEEYGEFQCDFSDSFAFLLTDKVTNQTVNLAVLPGGQIPVSVITVRDQKYNSKCSSENADYFDKYYGTPGTNPLLAPINYN